MDRARFSLVATLLLVGCPTPQGSDAGADVADAVIRDDSASTPTPGVPCTHDADCGAGGVCIPAARGWRGGYCTYACSDHAGPSVACGSQGTCAANPTPATARGPLSGMFVCLQACSLDTDCRDGYFCYTAFGTLRYCIPDCRTAPALLCAPGSCGDPVLGPQVCHLGCDACGANSVCGMSICACSNMTDCGTGRQCSLSIGLCQCGLDAYCPEGMHCNNGQCI